MPRRVAILNLVGLSPNLFGDHAPRLTAFARRVGGMRTIRPDLPAVTCTAQASMLTGLSPAKHGIVGNGWFDRTLGEVQFWKQSAGLVEAPRLWDIARARDPSVTCANCFWWHGMGSTAAIEVTPRPCYTADGRKIPDIAAKPAALREELTAALGPFPLFNFWGPRADIRSTDWIAAAAMEVARRHEPTIQLVYLPHLDYCLQKLGPRHPGVLQELRELDRVFGALLDFFDNRGVRVVVLSEYGIVPVGRAVHPNRALREAGLLCVRKELGLDMLDTFQSRAFCVCDHQVAHVYAADRAGLGEVRRVLASLPGVGEILDRPAQEAAGIAHARSGDLLLVSDPDAWFAYPYWLDDALAPDYARTVDIHRKPGYDPCELFVDPQLALPGVRVAWTLLRRRLGMRSPIRVTPLDASLVRGSHGRTDAPPGFAPVFLADDPRIDDSCLPQQGVRDALLAQVFEA